MISAGLPAIVVTDGLTTEPLASSAPIQNTAGEWVQQTIDFTAKDAPVVLVSLQRPPALPALALYSEISR